MKNFSQIFFLIFIISGLISAQNFWEPLPTSPSGGPFRSIKIDSNGNIFAVNNNMGVFRSVNNGDSWSDVFAQEMLGEISISPKGNIYIKNINKYDFKKYFFSTDNGDTWNALYDTVLSGKLCFSSNNYFFTSTNYGIYRSEDEGLTWQKLFDINNNLNVFAITADDKIFFQQSYGDYSIYYSQNYGDTWKNISSPQRYIYSINTIPNGYLFAGSDSIMFRSIDNGTTWQKALTITNKKNMYFNFIYVDKNGEIYASEYPHWGNNLGDLYKSTDNGNTWSLTALKDRDVSSIAVNSNGWIFAANSDTLWTFSNSNVFLSNGDGIFRSDDNGENWTQLNKGLSHFNISSLAISDNKIYAGTWRGLFISTDSGESWTQSYRDVNHGIGLSFEKYNTVKQISINKNKEIFIINGAGLLKSTDDGHQFQIVYSDTIHQVKKIWIDAQNNIFILSTHGGMKYSTDDGETWMDILSFDPNATLLIRDFAVNSLDHIFLCVNDPVYNGVFRSFDYGTTEFAQTNMKDKTVHYIAIDSNGKIYVTLGLVWDDGTSNSQVYFSTDEGDTWQWDGESKDHSYSSISTLAINPFNRVFVTTDDDIFILSDIPNNWEKINSGLPNSLGFLYYNPSFGFDNEGFAYLGTAGSYAYIENNGIYKSNYKVVTDVENQNILLPINYSLSQNYPNPFNPSTIIHYQIPQAGFVSLKVYDVLGKEVATLVNEEKPAGNYNVTFNGNNLSSGVYFYQIRTGSFVETKKLVLIR